VDFFDFAVGAHHAGLAPEGNREHSIGHQVSALNVGFMEHLQSFNPSTELASNAVSLIAAPRSKSRLCDGEAFYAEISMAWVELSIYAGCLSSKRCT
ncbi:hypothetical protein, partial [Pseudomonas putida]